MKLYSFRQFYVKLNKLSTARAAALVFCALLFIYGGWSGTCSYSFQLDFETNPPAYPREGIGKFADPGSIDITKVNTLCDTDEPLKVIIAVVSYVTNFKLRTAIRNTIGKFCSSYKDGCRMFFIIGMDENKHINEAINDELEENDDLLIMDKLDNYANLVDKSAVTVKWVDEHCKNAKYVLHANDDVYFNTPRFLEELEQNGGEECNCILGEVSYCSGPHRDPSSKAYNSYDAYPGTRFPWFASGAAYAFPNAITGVLHSAMYKAKYCWNEDIWLTGLVRVYCDIRLVNTQNAVLLYGKLNTGIINTHLYMHGVDETNFYKIHQNFNPDYHSISDCPGLLLNRITIISSLCCILIYFFGQNVE